MFIYILLLIVGFILLIKGSDLFVDGASDIAKLLKISPLIIGLTLCAIGTSLPELYVSVSSSIKGLNDLSLGNIIGSNIFDVLIVLGVTSLFGVIVINDEMRKNDIPSCIGIMIILLIFSFCITPYRITFLEALFIFVLFFLYMIYLIIRNHKKEIVVAEKPKRKWYILVLVTILGLAGVIGGGELTVIYASKIAAKLGLSELLISLTIISIGTSLPELVTSIAAIKKHEPDIALGNAIGSCIFNIILILGISGLINEITISNSILIDMLVMLASVIFVWILSIISKKIGKISGSLMILFYICYLAYLIITQM